MTRDGIRFALLVLLVVVGQLTLWGSVWLLGLWVSLLVLHALGLVRM